MNNHKLTPSIKEAVLKDILNALFVILLLIVAVNLSAQNSGSKYIEYDKVYNIDIKSDTVTTYINGLKIELENAKQQDDQYKTAEKSLFLGLIFLKLNSYDIATSYYLTALNKFTILKDTTYIIHSLRALSYVNLVINNDSIAIKYSLENLRYCELVKDTFLLEKNFINLGICYSNLNDEETAINYFNQAKEFGERINDTIFLQRIYYDIGAFYEKSKDYPKAEYYYHKSLNTEKGLLRDDMLGRIYHDLSAIAFEKGNFNKALSYINKSIEIAEELLSYKQLERYYKMYIKLLIKMDKTKELERAFSTYSEIQSKGFDADKAEQMAKVKILYEIDKFESEIELLVTKNKLNESKLVASTKRLIIAGIIILLVIIILVSTVVLYLRIKESHKKIVEENIKLIKVEEQNLQLQKIISQEKLKGVADTVNIYLKDGVDESQNEDSKSQNKLFAEVDYLLKTEKLYTNPELNINILAKKLNTNRTYLSKAINTVSAKSFIEFINEKRIEEAKRLLYSKESELITIDAIGQKAGFNSKATFFRVFKSISGVTPNYFLKNARR